MPLNNLDWIRLLNSPLYMRRGLIVKVTMAISIVQDTEVEKILETVLVHILNFLIARLNCQYSREARPQIPT